MFLKREHGCKKKGEIELNFEYEYKTLYDFTSESSNKNYQPKKYFFDFYSLTFQYGLSDRYNLIIEEKWFNYRRDMKKANDSAQL